MMSIALPPNRTIRRRMKKKKMDAGFLSVALVLGLIGSDKDFNSQSAPALYDNSLDGPPILDLSHNMGKGTGMIDPPYPKNWDDDSFYPVTQVESVKGNCILRSLTNQANARPDGPHLDIDDSCGSDVINTPSCSYSSASPAPSYESFEGVSPLINPSVSQLLESVDNYDATGTDPDFMDIPLNGLEATVTPNSLPDIDTLEELMNTGEPDWLTNAFVDHLGYGEPLDDISDKEFGGLIDTPPFTDVSESPVHTDSSEHASWASSSQESKESSLKIKEEPITWDVPGHNHTYSTGLFLPEVKSLRPAHSRHSSSERLTKDERLLREYRVPFTRAEIVDAGLKTFYEMLKDPRLSDVQQKLLKAVRRRGKNKIAARNCRARKTEGVVSLKNQLSDLELLQQNWSGRKQRVMTQLTLAHDHFEDLKRTVLRVVSERHPDTSLVEKRDGKFILVTRKQDQMIASQS